MRILKNDTYYWWFKSVNIKPTLVMVKECVNGQMLDGHRSDGRIRLLEVLRDFPHSLFVEVSTPKFSDQFVNEQIS